MDVEEICLKCENCLRVYGSFGMEEVEEKDGELIHEEIDRYNVPRQLYCLNGKSCLIFKELKYERPTSCNLGEFS